MKIEVIYDIGDQVLIDKDESIVGLILAVSITGVAKNVSYRVGWMQRGQSQSAWIDEWRLTPWGE